MTSKKKWRGFGQVGLSDKQAGILKGLITETEPWDQRGGICCKWVNDIIKSGTLCREPN